MKKHFFKATCTFAAIAATVFFTACSSEDSDGNKYEAGITEDNIQRMMTFNEAMAFTNQQSFQAYIGAGVTRSSRTDCFSFITSQNSYTVTYDNCDFGGQTLNGTTSVSYVVDGENIDMTSTYTNFSVAGYTFNGSNQVVFAAEYDTGNFVVSTTSDLTVSTPDGDTVTDTGTRNYTYSFGQDFTDFSFSFEGEWTTTLNGDAYEFFTSSVLEGNIDCEYIVSGVLNVAYNDTSASIDFGDGTCDNQAVLTISEVSQDITL
ncbi:hypothetical protein ACFQ1M_14390 [Sungkyunkwania multivorans]|uniref:Uncharacterized protein n=1 Tax=Sungkyunkwania multivorans TaxID=1173618 RepID=A0ABW3D2Y3_9FLAO